MPVLLFMLFLLIFPAAVPAYDSGVEAHFTTPEDVATDPGKIITASISVSNNTNGSLNLNESLILPPSWLAIIASSSFHLQPGERQVRIVAFRVPEDQYAGTHKVVYKADGRGLVAEEKMTVTVNPFFRLELMENETPASVIAGESYTATVQVFNRGNAPVRVELTVESIPNYPAGVDPAREVIDPGKSQIFAIRVKTEDGLKLKLDHILKIRAKWEGKRDEEIGMVRTLSVPVIPRMSGEREPYHRLASRLSLIAVGEGNKAGVQVEYAGGGSLDETGTRWIEFVFRGPDAQKKGLFGRWDEYRLSYGDNLMELNAGDKNYSLSPLTELYRYGRGAEANFRFGAFETGLYFLQTRWDDPKVRELAGYFQYRVNEYLSIRTNLLGKEKEESAFSSERKDGIASIEARVNHGEKLDFSAEYGISRPVDDNAKDGSAYRAQAHGRLSDRVSYSAEKIHASPGFAGYRKDFDSTMASASFPLLPHLQGNISYRNLKYKFEVTEPVTNWWNTIGANAPGLNTPGWDDCNLSQNRLDPVCYNRVGVKEKEKSYKGGLSYTFPWKSVLSLDYEDFSREAPIPSFPTDFTERGFTLGVGHVFQKVIFQAYGEMWNLNNGANGTVKNGLMRHSLYTNFHFSDRYSFGINMQTGNERYSGSTRRTRSGGVYGQWRPSLNVRINLNYQRSEVTNDDRNIRDSLSSWVSWTLPNSHLIDARWLWTDMNGEGEDEDSFLVAYTVPIGIPVSRKTSVGSLRGRVYDTEAPGRPALSKVILNASGVYAVTDGKGEYLFPSLTPGTYYLWVDKGSLGLTKVFAGKMPIKVEVAGGTTVTLDIAVATAGAISGVVGVMREQGSEVLPQILIEARSGEIVLRQVTDGKGRFSFEELPSGKWTVKARSDNLPDLHRFEKDEFEMELKPGEKRTLQINVVPRKREIRIIEQGEIRAEK